MVYILDSQEDNKGFIEFLEKFDCEIIVWNVVCPGLGLFFFFNWRSIRLVPIRHLIFRSRMHSKRQMRDKLAIVLKSLAAIRFKLRRKPIILEHVDSILAITWRRRLTNIRILSFIALSIVDYNSLIKFRLIMVKTVFITLILHFLVKRILYNKN